MTHRLSLSLLVVLGFAARAQTPVPVQPATIPLNAAPAFDSLPPFERPNGTLLRDGTLTYSVSLSAPTGQIIPLGTRTVTVSATTLGGMPAWLIDEARRGTVVESTDSLYVSRADLTPERWIATIGRAQLGASISRDSIFGAMDSYRGRSSFVLALPPGALLTAGMVERLVELLPLRLGYRAGATLLLIDGPDPRVIPAEIIVERDDHAQFGSRAVNCWVVILRAGALEQRLWVTKDGARVVRTEQAVADGLLTATLQP